MRWTVHGVRAGWPLGSQANALNVSANHSILLLNRGRANDALQMMDANLADARKWGPEVSAGALAAAYHDVISPGS